MKLKTLKDMVEECSDVKFEDMEYGIRQEAIKWAREIKKNYYLQNTTENVSYQYDTSWKNYDKGIQFIKHFFNLSDGDLK